MFRRNYSAQTPAFIFFSYIFYSVNLYVCESKGFTWDSLLLLQQVQFLSIVLELWKNFSWTVLRNSVGAVQSSNFLTKMLIQILSLNYELWVLKTHYHLYNMPPIVDIFEIFVLSIFKWPLKTDFTVNESKELLSAYRMVILLYCCYAATAGRVDQAL